MLELEYYQLDERVILKTRYTEAEVTILGCNFPVYKVRVNKLIETSWSLSDESYKYKIGAETTEHYSYLYPADKTLPQKPYDTDTLLRVLIEEIKELRNDLQK